MIPYVQQWQRKCIVLNYFMTGLLGTLLLMTMHSYASAESKVVNVGEGTLVQLDTPEALDRSDSGEKYPLLKSISRGMSLIDIEAKLQPAEELGIALTPSGNKVSTHRYGELWLLSNDSNLLTCVVKASDVQYDCKNNQCTMKNCQWYQKQKKTLPLKTHFPTQSKPALTLQQDNQRLQKIKRETINKKRAAELQRKRQLEQKKIAEHKLKLRQLEQQRIIRENHQKRINYQRNQELLKREAVKRQARIRQRNANARNAQRQAELKRNQMMAAQRDRRKQAKLRENRIQQQYLAQKHQQRMQSRKKYMDTIIS